MAATGSMAARSFGQSFRPQHTGLLTHVAFEVVMGSYDGELSIFNGEGNTAVSTQPLVIPGAGLIFVALENPVPVTAGNLYSFRASTMSPETTSVAQSTNTYPKGRQYRDGTWVDNRDTIFLIRVAPCAS